jgi:hypothetical protein
MRARAAPALRQFREFYRRIVRDKTYRQKAGQYRRKVSAGNLHAEKSLQKKIDELDREIDWVENEYRSCSADSGGLFSWSAMPGQAHPRLFFRLESADNVRRLIGCVETFSRWEASFDEACGSLEREFRQRDDTPKRPS